MNHLLSASCFLQELRKKKNDIGTEEEKKMKDGRPSELLPWLQ